MDLPRAIRFPFEDRDWLVKTVVGTLLSFIPFFALGYQISTARNVMRGKEDPMPGTSDIGQVLTDGVMGTIAGLIYVIPLLPFFCVLMVIAGIAGDSDAAGLFVLCSFTCLAVLSLPYALAAGALYWMGVLRYCDTGNFSEFIRFGSLWRDVRANMGTMLALLGYGIALSLLSMLVSPIFVITCIGAPLLGFWNQVATGHLVGQAGIEVMRG